MSAASPDPVWKVVLDRTRADNDLAYGRFVSRWPLDYYRQRLRQIGFQGYERVLDVGSGLGQWSLALAADNREVRAIDIHAKRVATSNALFRSVWAESVSASVASATEIPLADESFDAVFCYGVFMFVDRKAALAEFRRVLRPGGRIYICTNARGWWLKLALGQALKNRTLARTGWNSFRRGSEGLIPNATDIDQVDDVLRAEGRWEEVRAGAEGTLTIGPEPVAPVYAAKFLGFDSVIEFTATKPAAQESGATATASRETNNLLFRRVEQALAADHYSYEQELLRYPVAGQHRGDGQSSNPAAVAFAASLGRHIDRTAALRRIFAMATEDAKTTESKVVACITLAQKLFYHHFAVQPLVKAERALHDPIASIIFGACRCGNAARFLVDLLAVNGLDARLLGGSCHTSAEVDCDGRWVLADASLFPPGIVPRNSSGALVSLEDVAADPGSLDAVPSYVNYHADHVARFRSLYPAAYEPISRWLNGPLLPSVAFFGAEFFADGRRPGLVQRWRKIGDAEDWEQDAEYGWRRLEELPGVQGPALPTAQRSRQVTDLRREGRWIRWEVPQDSAGEVLSYEVVAATRPRGWSYDEIPVGFAFRDTRDKTVVDETELALPESMAGQAVHVTVWARRPADGAAFVLPSREFDLPANGTVIPDRA